MASSLNAVSLKKLQGVHPDLVRVAKRAAEDPASLRFVITCGLRTMSEQKRLVAAGASRTLKSRHLTGHAFDFAVIVGGKIVWAFALYEQQAQVFKRAAAAEGVKIEWGGDWQGFRDGPHIQLPWTVIDNPGFVKPGGIASLPPAPMQPLPQEMNLVAGARGDEVRRLQGWLLTLGHRLALDGDFGPATAVALRQTQISVGRKPTGVLTPKDAKAIEAAAKKAAKAART